MEESKNIFVYDKPVGRKWFIINIIIIFLIAVLFAIVMGLIKTIFEINAITKPILIGLFWTYFLTSLYLFIVNYAKRIYDIISDKPKALLYTILFMAGTYAMTYIPYMKLLDKIISIAFILFLLFKKGNMLKSEISEVLAPEEENNNVDQVQ